MTIGQPTEQATPQRFQTLDVLRGFAVMGILLMNIIGFAMPEPAYINPRAWGGTDAADLLMWSANFIFVDSKMRSLFSILFGASMLLFISRAEAREGDARRLHFSRMGWLALFGWLHYALIWDGDILFLYALMGMIAWHWRDLSPASLFRRAAVLIAFGMALWGLILWGVAIDDAKATASGADQATIARALETRADFGEPGSARLSDEIKLFRSDYETIFNDRAVTNGWDPLTLIAILGFETLGLMALGMGLLRTGFLTGALSSATYLRAVLFGLGGGTIAMLGIAAYCAMRGYETLTVADATLVWSVPFRAPMAIGYAAFFILLAKAFASSRWLARVEAAGKAAFSNYIGTSLVMTSIFYGYGLGLYGHIGRVEVYGFVLIGWALMLLWSKPWMDRHHHGPLEWLWRSLTRMQIVHNRR